MQSLAGFLCSVEARYKKDDNRLCKSMVTANNQTKSITAINYLQVWCVHAHAEQLVSRCHGNNLEMNIILTLWGWHKTSGNVPSTSPRLGCKHGHNTSCKLLGWITTQKISNGPRTSHLLLWTNTSTDLLHHCSKPHF